MTTVKSTTPEVSLAELDDFIEGTACLEADHAEQAKKIKLNRERIKELLAASGRASRVTIRGFKAELVDCQKRVWEVARLAKVLDEKQFEALCPRKPEGGKLTKLMEIDAAKTPKLLKCCAIETTQRLDLSAPAQAAAEKN